MTLSHSRRTARGQSTLPLHIYQQHEHSRGVELPASLVLRLVLFEPSEVFLHFYFSSFNSAVQSLHKHPSVNTRNSVGPQETRTCNLTVVVVVDFGFVVGYKVRGITQKKHLITNYLTQ